MQREDAERILWDAVERGEVEYIPPYHPPMGAGMFAYQGERIPTNSTCVIAMAQRISASPAIEVTPAGPAYLLPGLTPTDETKGDATQRRMF